MKKSLKERAITLIALVVTIIILLILAGVTIGFATNGTGLFEKAKLATDEYNNKVAEENFELGEITKDITEHISGTNRDVSEDRIREIVNEELLKWSPYPKGTPQTLVTISGKMSAEQTTTAPGDGWIKLEANCNNTANYYALTVGNLNKAGGADAWQGYGACLPCTKGLTITYRVWGNGNNGGKLTFIPMSDSTESE